MLPDLSFIVFLPLWYADVSIAQEMTSSMDSSHSFHRRTLVEEALESMECATPLPVLYGGTSTILNEDMLEDVSFSDWI